jgi:hypothetical protein
VTAAVALATGLVEALELERAPRAGGRRLAARRRPSMAFAGAHRSGRTHRRTGPGGARLDDLLRADGLPTFLGRSIVSC